jgi:hypothetical protein
MGVFGSYGTVIMANDAVRIVLVPELGGRVVSLADRRSEREWLVQGQPPSRLEAAAWAREDADFGGRQAFGWDECLPTIGACPDPLAPDGPYLRDHGAQWGRASRVTVDRTSDSIRVDWTDGRWPFAFSRTLRLGGSAVAARYSLENFGANSLDFLWSMHALLDLPEGTRIDLPAGTRLSMPFASGRGLTPSGSERSVIWPNAPKEPGHIDLSRVPANGQPVAAKLYANLAPVGAVRAVTPNGAWIAFDWSREIAPALGLWLNYGGWPHPSNDIRQVSIEPTTSGHGDLAAARSDRAALRLDAGAKVSWEVCITLESSGEMSSRVSCRIPTALGGTTTGTAVPSRTAG